MARKSGRFTAIEKGDMLPVCTTEKTEIKVALYARISVDCKKDFSLGGRGSGTKGYYA